MSVKSRLREKERAVAKAALEKWSILKSDGTVVERQGQPTLWDLQKSVGGYIEDLCLLPGGRCMSGNEDGRELKLARNDKASNLFSEATGRPNDLYGDIVIFERHE